MHNRMMETTLKFELLKVPDHCGSHYVMRFSSIFVVVISREGFDWNTEVFFVCQFDRTVLILIAVR